MSWTPEKEKKLRELWTKGYTASQIAGMIEGTTRNAVIGKIHRLGLSNRGNASQKDRHLGSNKESKTNQKFRKKTTLEKFSSADLNQKINVENEKKIPPKRIKKDSLNAPPQSTSKPIIFTANHPLPPQPSTSEISEETLKNVKSLEKKSKKLSLMELTERTCKWPIGDPATEKFWFCGHVAEPGKPYCETHIEIAFQPVASRRERRLR